MFDTDLAIRSETRKKMSETYSHLLRSRTVLLTLTSDKSSAKTGVYDKQLHDSHVSRWRLCSYMYSTCKAYLLLKRQLKNKTWMKGICYDITSTLDSSAGYREKRSHYRNDRFTLGVKAYCPTMRLTKLIKVEFQPSVSNTVTYFDMDFWCEKKLNTTRSGYEKNLVCLNCSTEVEGWRFKPPKSTLNTLKIKL